MQRVLLAGILALSFNAAFAKDRVIESPTKTVTISKEQRSITVTNKSDWEWWCDFGYAKGKKYTKLNYEDRKEYRIVAFATKPGETTTAAAEKLAEIRRAYLVTYMCSTGGDPDKRPPRSPEQKETGSAFKQEKQIMGSLMLQIT